MFLFFLLCDYILPEETDDKGTNGGLVRGKATYFILKYFRRTHVI